MITGTAATRTAEMSGDERNWNCRLAIWFSPMFPVGAFAYSHGLEWAHEAGDISDADDLRDWLATSGAARRLAQRCDFAGRGLSRGNAARRGSHPRGSMNSRWQWRPAANGGSRRQRRAMPFCSRYRNRGHVRALDLLRQSEDIAYPVAVGDRRGGAQSAARGDARHVLPRLRLATSSRRRSALA